MFAPRKWAPPLPRLLLRKVFLQHLSRFGSDEVLKIELLQLLAVFRGEGVVRVNGVEVISDIE